MSARATTVDNAAVCASCRTPVPVGVFTFMRNSMRRRRPERLIVSVGVGVHRCRVAPPNDAIRRSPAFVSLSGPWSGFVHNDSPSAARDRSLLVRGAVTRAFEAIAGSPIGPVCDVRAIARRASRLYEMRADDVREVLDALDGAEVSTRLAGGWGVDALVGTQTRRHSDLDLLITDNPSELRAASDALSSVGFRFVRERPPSVQMPRRINFADGRGRSVDLLPFALGSGAFQDENGSLFVTGRIGDRKVECITPEMQFKLHEGVPAKAVYDADLDAIRRHLERSASPASSENGDDGSGGVRQHPAAQAQPDIGTVVSRIRRDWTPSATLARARLMAPASALIIPVPAVEAALAEFRSRHDPAAGLGMPAHVTVFYPFLRFWQSTSDVETELELAFARSESFRFKLAGVGKFPGVLYLAPDPPEPFIEATLAVQQRWPRLRPYGGAHAEIVPHLSVAHDSWPAEVEGALERLLPIEAEAREVWWLEQDRSGRWTRRSRIPLREESPLAGRQTFDPPCV